MTADPAPPARLSLAHRAWRLLPRGPRRAAAHRIACALAPRPDREETPVQPGLAVAGELDRASGLGEAARLILRGVESLGLPAYPIRPGDPPAPPGVPLLLVGTGPSMPVLLRRLGGTHLRGRTVIGHWAWELPVVPPAWRDGLRFVHRLWASSRFTADALRPLAPGVRPLVMPVATGDLRPAARGRDAFGLPADALVTLTTFNLASSFERKNPLAAIAAHRQAFGDRPDRIMLLHVLNPHHFPADFARLQAASGGNVRLDVADLSRSDNQALIACSDIVLSLHRSEGFGLLPAEAMLLGKPVVATDWSATAEFLDAGCGMPVPARLVPVADPRGVYAAPGAQWAEPDVAAAAAALERLAADPALRARLGAAAQAAATTRLGADDLRIALDALRAPVQIGRQS